MNPPPSAPLGLSMPVHVTASAQPPTAGSAGARQEIPESGAVDGGGLRELLLQIGAARRSVVVRVVGEVVRELVLRDGHLLAADSTAPAEDLLSELVRAGAVSLAAAPRLIVQARLAGLPIVDQLACAGVSPEVLAAAERKRLLRVLAAATRAGGTYVIYPTHETGYGLPIDEALERASGAHPLPRWGVGSA